MPPKIEYTFQGSLPLTVTGSFLLAKSTKIKKFFRENRIYDILADCIYSKKVSFSPFFVLLSPSQILDTSIHFFSMLSPFGGNVCFLCFVSKMVKKVIDLSDMCQKVVVFTEKMLCVSISVLAKK